MYFDPTSLPLDEYEVIDNYLNEETLYMPAEDYSDGANKDRNHIFRRNAVHVVCRYSMTNDQFDAFIPYLAMNYFDRFISRNELPGLRNDGTHDVRFLAYGCLSLAWKMRSYSTYKIFLKTKRRARVTDDDLLKIERRILNVLRWRMRTINAFCFVNYFSRTIPKGVFKRRCINEIIIQSQGDIKFTKLKPSLLAASAILAATMRLYPALHMDYTNKLRTGTNAELDFHELYYSGVDLGVMILQLHLEIESEETFYFREEVKMANIIGDPASQPSLSSSSSSSPLRRLVQEWIARDNRLRKATKLQELKYHYIKNFGTTTRRRHSRLSPVQQDGSEIEREEDPYRSRRERRRHRLAEMLKDKEKKEVSSIKQRFKLSPVPEGSEIQEEEEEEEDTYICRHGKDPIKVEGSGTQKEQFSNGDTFVRRPGKEPKELQGSKIQEKKFIHRPGKEPMEHDGIEFQEEQQSEDDIFVHRPGKEPIEATDPEIKEEHPRKERPGGSPEEEEPLGIETNESLININLKWIRNDNENLFIDPSYFLPLTAEAPFATEANANTPANVTESNAATPANVTQATVATETSSTTPAPATSPDNTIRIASASTPKCLPIRPCYRPRS